jgi:hypothetical protein
MTHGSIHFKFTSENIRFVDFAIRMWHILLSASFQAINSTKMVVFWVVTPCFLVYADISDESATAIIILVINQLNAQILVL